MNNAIAEFIAAQNPRNVFEFGCHDGRNLALLQALNHNITCSGIDINPRAIANGIRKWKSLFLFCGDESRLKENPNLAYDVVFTSSVLCHIEQPKEIISDLVRMAKRGVLLCETQEIKGKYYWAHDYRSMGFKLFKSMKSVPEPQGNGALYDFWWLQK